MSLKKNIEINKSNEKPVVTQSKSKTISKITLKEMQTEKHWCMNRSKIPGHDQTNEAVYYCLIDKAYLCENCTKEHSLHSD